MFSHENRPKYATAHSNNLLTVIVRRMSVHTRFIHASVAVNFHSATKKCFFFLSLFPIDTRTAAWTVHRAPVAYRC